MSTSNATTTAYGFPAGVLAILALTVVSPGVGSLVALVTAAVMGIGVRKNVDAIPSPSVSFIGR